MKLTKLLREHKKVALIVAGLVAVAVLTLVAAFVPMGAKDTDDPYGKSPRTMSLTDTVCDMLKDGDTPAFAYSVAKDLAHDHPFTYPDADLAARAAVSAAQARGCGA